jgi:hypothetical protein
MFRISKTKKASRACDKSGAPGSPNLRAYAAGSSPALDVAIRMHKTYRSSSRKTRGVQAPMDETVRRLSDLATGLKT